MRLNLAAQTLFCASLLLGMRGVPALGQWSANPAANLAVADGADRQDQPKIRATSDGGCFVSWYGPGYDMYLQRLDAAGVEQWAHNGIMLEAGSFSSSEDYDLRVDPDNNAVVVYRDNSSGSVQIRAHKISAAGSLLWGPSGAVASVGTADKGMPRCAVLTDGSVAVGWSEGINCIIQKLDSNGAPQWAAPGVTISDSGTTLSLLLSDLQGSDMGSVIALWVRPQRFGTGLGAPTARQLHTQKFDSTGAAIWNGGSPVIIFAGATASTSIQNGYFPPFLSDGAGGAVYGWYENGNNRNAYIQHVLANGTLKFSGPIANTGATTGRIRIGAGLAYKPSTGNYYLVSPESGSPTQGNYTLIAQRFDDSGNRLWGDSGALVMDQRGAGVTIGSPSFVQCQLDGDGLFVASFREESSTTRNVLGAVLAPDGRVRTTRMLACVASGKGRLSTAVSTQGFLMVAWHDTSVGGSDVFVQNLRSGGRLDDGPAHVPGDGNCDRAADGDDVQSFAIALISPTTYLSVFACCRVQNLDMNGDGVIDSLDIPAFVNALLNS